MESVPEETPSGAACSDIFLHLCPRSLLTHKRRYLGDLYTDLRSKGVVRDVQKDAEKLWAVFDAALEADHPDFLSRYLDEVCFSPELIPFGSDTYFHGTRVILDWCKNFHTEAELHILNFDPVALMHLPKKCDGIEVMLNRCLSHTEGDPRRREQREMTVKGLLSTTKGLKLASMAASWMQSSEVGHGRNDEICCLPSDSYLASQSLPPPWLEQYPFLDHGKILEIVFVSKDVLGNENLKFSKLAILGFYLLHCCQVTSLEFLTRVFDVDPALVFVWQGIFLIDLCSFDRHFQKPATVMFAVRSLRDAMMQHPRPLPIESLMKLQSLGSCTEAKELFIEHLRTYFDALPNPVTVARQGLTFCLSSGDIQSGMTVFRTSLRRLRGPDEAIDLLHRFFDQILGSGRLEDLIMQDFTGMEEAVFVDWAGNKRDDPECSLYLALYFLRRSNLEAARQLHRLNVDKLNHSIHKELWMEIGQALRFIPTSDGRHSNRQMEDLTLIETDYDDETDRSEADEYDELESCRTGMPAHLLGLMKRSLQTGSPLMPTYSESFYSHGLCPLHPPEREAVSVEPSVSVGTHIPTREDVQATMDTVPSETDSEEFQDVMETDDITF